MRRLRGERGGTTVMVALASALLAGGASLVVDVGAVFAEKRELQNGADAAALGMAVDCARNKPTCGQRAAAQQLLDGNASDGTSELVHLEVDDVTDNDVLVWAGTADTGGRHSLAMRFAGVFGIHRSRVHAVARAAWGYPREVPSDLDGNAYPTMPLAVGGCEFDAATNLGRDFGRPIVIYFHEGGNSGVIYDCARNPSGQDRPGNFGWIDRTSACEAAIREIGPTRGDSGNSPPGGCHDDFERLLGQTIALPMFRFARGTGANATYEISGWATFHLTAYNLGGPAIWTAPSGRPPCTGGDRCIAGWFTNPSVRAEPGGEAFGPAAVSLKKPPRDATPPPGAEDPEDAPADSEEEQP